MGERSARRSRGLRVCISRDFPTRALSVIRSAVSGTGEGEANNGRLFSHATEYVSASGNWPTITSRGIALSSLAKIARSRKYGSGTYLAARFTSTRPRARREAPE